jgi:ATP/ADP translocase
VSRVRQLVSFAARAVPVEPGEWRKVWPVLLANFVLVAGVTVGRNARDSLFIKKFGVLNLPYMYVAGAFLVVVSAIVYARLARRLERRRFLTFSYLLYAVLLGVSTLVLTGKARWPYPALYMLVQVIWILSLMQFWSAAADLFETRQAKRLFPFVASGGLLGSIGMGFITPPAVRLLGTANLLLVWSASLIVALLLVRHALARYLPPDTVKRTASRARRPAGNELAEGFRLARNSRLVAAMAGICSTLWVVFVLVDFQFSRVVNAAYATPDALTAFLGTFRGTAFLVALLVQLLVTPRLVARFGVGRAMLIHPAAMVGSTSVLLLWFGFGSAAGAKFLDHVMLWGIQESSLQMLYNPLSAENRARARALVEGNLKSLSTALGGVLLLLAYRLHLPAWQITGLALAFAAAWLAYARKVGNAYLEALLADLAGNLRPGAADSAAALASLSDPAALERLVTELRNATPAQALLAIHLLERVRGPKTEGLLSRLTKHPEATVRATAVAALGREHSAVLLELLPDLLADRDARVRANTLAALPPGEPGPEVEAARECLRDEHRRVRANAIRVQARRAAARGAQDELATLLEVCRLMCADSDRLTRQAGAYAVGSLPTHLAQPLLLDVLADFRQAPWKQALDSLAETGDEECVGAVLRAAEVFSASHAAYRAIARIHARRPGPVLERLLAVLNTPEERALRRAALTALGKIEDPASLPELARLVPHAEPELREHLLDALARIAETHPLPEEFAAGVRAAVREETKALATVREQQLTVARALPGLRVPLEPLLADDATRILQTILSALGTVSDRNRIAVIRRYLIGGAGARERANALEALEYLAGAEMGRELVRIIEGKAFSPRAPEELLESFLCHRSAPVRACAVYLAGEIAVGQAAGPSGQPTGREASPAAAASLEAAAHSGEHFIREAALHSLWRMGRRDGDVRPFLRDPHPSVRRYAESLQLGKPMLITIEKLLFLKSIPLFAALPGENLLTMADICSEEQIPADAIVIREHDEGNDLYVIVSGRVKVYSGQGSYERRLAELGERECFGEMALIDGEVRSASVATLEPCSFLVIRGEDFRELMLEEPALSLAVMKVLSQRLRKADEAPAIAEAASAPQFV